MVTHIVGDHQVLVNAVTSEVLVRQVSDYATYRAQLFLAIACPHKYANDFQKHGPNDHQHHEPSGLSIESAGNLPINRQAQTRISEIRGVQRKQTSLRR